MKRYQRIKRYARTPEGRPSGLFMICLGLATFIARPPEPSIWSTIHVGIAWVISVSFSLYVAFWLFAKMEDSDDE